MIKLNDYLYNGDTVNKILHNYHKDLSEAAAESGNVVDIKHCDFLRHMIEMLEHNDFLSSQSQRIREYYKYMTEMYPTLAFTFKGRIKSLIRAEAKFNAFITEFIYDYYTKTGDYPSEAELLDRLDYLRDFIAYRIIISVPKCHMADAKQRHDEEIRYLYEIANSLPAFLAERGFELQNRSTEMDMSKSLIDDKWKAYYKDYIVNSSEAGYQSLHICLYDTYSDTYLEMQLRTKEMDDYAEIGPANHLGYEKNQESERYRRDKIPVGENLYYDEAFERGMQLRKLELKDIDVNMFAAVDNSLINDGCGLFRGRLILPYEHLSRFQNNLID